MVGYTKAYKRGGAPPTPKEPGIYKNAVKAPHRYFWNKSPSKIVIVVGANREGGVEKWKEPREWKTENTAIQDKRRYALRHGYDVVVKDLTFQKKHSHEHREAWAKFDILREAIRDHPEAEWFWYVDMNSYIMMPEISLEELIWSHSESISRDKTEYFHGKPSKTDSRMPYVDYDEPVELIVSQDCLGFNLESFFIRRSEWTDMLLDVMFDPIFYKALHVKWVREEASALEYFYDEQAWVRSRVGFMPFRHFNSLARGCADSDKPYLFTYNETDGDFMVNMHNCRNRGDRNCHDEMEYYAQLAEELHSSWFTNLFG
ncbi:glycosyltransferase family 34 protein [Babjeviella inositovora NRRL Y-12698]|uniref:Glycosyltransferase family 34 protein n=1 Tax=Babjeviella inositovora NRRL Y-12698 TaxID=984486 RepID=A0A1E3QNX6_9ASCO|nr:glycosyltransferase family 34 protein [Babjeviella inositovora NRRL Y-12698]ODQ79350.1 glycosyltransferase family 34 protein [Babjeviella inositovora NRRL Y-12698]